MRARDVDLSTIYEGIKYRYELLNRPVPWALRLYYAVTHWIFRRWQF